MPVISVEGPPVGDIDRKREFVKKVTDAAVEMYGLQRSAMIVLLRENTADNVGVSGELLQDRLSGGRKET